MTDELCSSGMCKAGFAGDDAPRAVFRKFLYSSAKNAFASQNHDCEWAQGSMRRMKANKQSQHPLLDVLATMGKTSTPLFPANS